MEQSDSPPSGVGQLKGNLLRFQLLILSVLLLPLISLSAQITPSSELDFLDQEHRKESLKELALEEIAENEYQEALDHVNAALSLSPEDRELQDLKRSIEDLLILEEEHGVLGYIDPEDPNFSDFQKPDEEVIISPDFAEELLTDAQREDPSIKRNAFSLEIGNAYGQTQALYLSDSIVLNETTELPSNPYYRISADAEAFFFKNKRNLGMGIHYKDVPYNQNDVDMLERMFDMTLHYRGFFAETMESRLILGAKAGVGFLGIKEDLNEDNIADGDISNPTIFVAGVYFSDALFRYLFKDSTFFKRLVIEMDFDFIFVASLDDVSLSQYSISAGYQFTDHFAFSVFSEAFNTSTSLQNTNSWEIGGRFKLSY
jgi:hypothetical protein